MSRALVLALPAGGEAPEVEGLVAALRERNFAILGRKALTLSAEQAEAFYAEHDGSADFAPLVTAITMGPLVALALELPGAAAALAELLAVEGLSKLHISPPVDVARELKAFFPEVFPKETTFALITPDAEEAGVRAEMVARLEGAGFVVLKQDLQTLPHAKARALAPGASEAQLALLGAAPSCLLALEKPFAVGELMALAGPSDPRLAKERAPASLRARYGADALRNAIEVATSADDAAARLAAAFGPRAFVGAPDERSVALLLPEATASGGAEAAALALKAAGFKVLAAKEVALSAEAAAELLAGADAGIVERATSGPVTAIAVSRPHAVCALGSLCGRAGALGLAAADGEGRSAIACAPSAAAAAAGVAALFPELLGLQTTLAIIKPDAVRAGAVDAIVARIEAAGFVVRARTSLALPAFKAEEFYAEHKGRPFLPNLVAFMSSGPCVALALSRVGAIAEWRALMGPTRTAAAREQQPGCLRALYGTDNTANATHGSDSPLSARRELKFWFPALSAQPLPAPSDVGGLVSQQLEPALVGALVELCKAKPDDPVRWLGAYLLTHNPNKPKVAQLVNPPARPAAKKAAPSHEVPTVAVAAAESAPKGGA